MHLQSDRNRPDELRAYSTEIPYLNPAVFRIRQPPPASSHIKLHYFIIKRYFLQYNFNSFLLCTTENFSSFYRLKPVEKTQFASLFRFRKARERGRERKSRSGNGKIEKISSFCLQNSGVCAMIGFVKVSILYKKLLEIPLSSFLSFVNNNR